MNTKVHMTLETLPMSFGMAKRILKDYKGVHMGVKDSLGSFTKKKKKNTK